ncbi:hypothetical protein ACJRO7_032173 [Eucalyptus globulus]|uniref:Dienelactone hydrolase domain-containing protein n=1 Tax=Eucalyptus globulus TaxID=34317 RepID=A0ABD3JMB5_EUCGL
MSSSQCFENPPDLSSTCGAGRVEELAGLKTYVTGPSDSKCAIILIADVFGIEPISWILILKLADKVASAGFLVVVPDFLYGDPIDLSNPNFDRGAWKKIHSTDKGYEDVKPVISALRSKGMSAIGAAGFCWGGKVLVKLAGIEDIQAAVILHPGHMTEDEIQAVKIPTAILGAEIDHASPPEELKKFGEIMSAKTEFESYVKIFPSVSHGWSVRYDDNNEFAVKSAEEAQKDMLNWFLKHVK